MAASSSATAAARQQRLAVIASEWGVGPLPPIARPTKPLQPYSIRSPQDDLAAEELLKRRRLAASSETQQRSPNLRRAFTTTKRKGWEPNEIFAALDAHVDQGGSPGVAEALLVKLLAVGGDVNVANTKTKTNLLTRRRSVESFERSRLLQRAIEHKNGELVAVLVPYADPLTLDSSLPTAIQSRRLDIVEHLLRYGASAANSAAGKDAFRLICSEGGHADLIALMMVSDGRPGPSDVSPAMVDAAKRGCLESVLRLSHSTADGGYNNAAALREAIIASRVDIALAIVTGTKPPHSTLLNETFKILFTHPSVLPNEKMALAEVLLCAGAGGDIVSSALVQSCINNNSEMIALLVYYGASVDYDNGAVLRHTLTEKKLSVAQLLLSDSVTVTPHRASECIAYLPKTLTNEERFLLLVLLLRKGATGPPLSDCLIDVTEVGDVESAKLLLTPIYPEHVINSPTEQQKPYAERLSPSHPHHIASVNHKDGMALQLAVKSANFSIVEAILAKRPSPEILATVFPTIFNLPPDQRYRATELFLATGFSGPVVTGALQQAIQEPPQDRDQKLITLLLRSNADISFAGGAGLVAAVVNGDVGLLQTILLNSAPTKQALGAALSQTITIADPQARLRAVSSLLSAGAGQERAAVADLLIATLSAQPMDDKLVTVLLKQGQADINHKAGAAVVLAASHPDAKLLHTILHTKLANQDTLTRGLYALSGAPSTGTKAVKLTTLLRYTKPKGPLNDLLVAEVQILVKTPAPQRIFSTVQALLSAGADVNAHNAAALCHAVAAPVSTIVEMILKQQPTPATLAIAIPRIFNISDAMDRFSLAKMLLEAGVPTYEASRALNHAVVNIPQDPSLLKLLAAAADPEDGSAVLSAVRSKGIETLSILLASKQFSVPVLSSAFTEAMKVTDKESRQAICAQLMRAGATGSAVSDALVAAAADGDIGLGSILLENGASADHKDGEAIVSACRSGALDVLQMLLKSQSVLTKGTLTRGFEEATNIDDLEQREAVLRLLLDRGVSADAISKQLISSASYGDDGVSLVRLLLQHGADTNYNKGEAVRTSARNGFTTNLRLLLGIEKDESSDTAGKSETRIKASQDTMARALKVSWMLKSDTRYRIIQCLFAAGLEPSEAVHLALSKAIKEDEPNIDLVRLLLDHGASPLADGCQALVNAASRCLPSILELSTSSTTPIAKADLDYLLTETFRPARIGTWLTQDGLDTASLLLKKGATSDELGRVLLVCVEKCGSEDGNVARQFVQLLCEHEADVSYDGGSPLQAAAKLGDVAIVRQLLLLHPSSDSVSMAFSFIFESNLSEDTVVALIETFREHRISDPECGLDVMFKHPVYEPVVFHAITRYPRSVRILEALLDIGYYHDQMTTVRVAPDIDEDESVSLLFWALLQPQKKISSALVELLIEKECKVNFETPLSMMTPLMLAIQSKRPDIVKALIRAGAEVNVADRADHTPLLMAVYAGGDIGNAMMADILEAGASKNDGSLHVAAQSLNLTAMKMLVSYKHDIEYPSPLHGGRSALSEICLHGCDGETMTASRIKTLEQCLSFLIDQGSDIQLRTEGKTPLLLALEAHDPIVMTQALLKAGLYKYVNSPFNQYHHNAYTFSPTMYVALVLQPPVVVRDKLLAVLRTSRAEDLYYAQSGPQPPHAVNVPPDLMQVERERLAQLQRDEAEEQRRARERRHAHELAELATRARQEELRALNERADAEAKAARRKALADAQAQVDAAQLRAAGEAQAMRQRAAAQAEAEVQVIRARSQAEAEAYRVRSAAQAAAEAASLQNLVLRREADHAADREQARQLGEQHLQLEDRKQRMLLSHEQQLRMERATAAQQLSSIRVDEAETLSRLGQQQHRRDMMRLAEGQKLANAVRQLPPAGQQMVGGPANRNVAGYIMGEIQ